MKTDLYTKLMLLIITVVIVVLVLRPLQGLMKKKVGRNRDIQYDKKVIYLSR